VLEHETDVALARRRVRHFLVTVVDLAGVGRFQAGDDAQQRRLARPGRTEQRQQGAAVGLHAYAVKRLE
jgi:hypothetical protein